MSSRLSTSRLRTKDFQKKRSKHTQFRRCLTAWRACLPAWKQATEASDPCQGLQAAKTAPTRRVVPQKHFRDSRWCTSGSTGEAGPRGHCTHCPPYPPQPPPQVPQLPHCCVLQKDTPPEKPRCGGKRSPALPPRGARWCWGRPPTQPPFHSGPGPCECQCNTSPGGRGVGCFRLAHSSLVPLPHSPILPPTIDLSLSLPAPAPLPHARCHTCPWARTGSH